MSAITYGSGKAGDLGRIYDRLRKRALRASRRPRRTASPHEVYGDIGKEAYIAGVRDALAAVNKEILR